MNPDSASSRAQRYGVKWPVRVRRLDEATWSTGGSVNLSISGILLEIPRPYRVGDRVEVEIIFLAHPDARTIIRSLGHVVREQDGQPGGTAVQFDVERGVQTNGRQTDALTAALCSTHTRPSFQ